MCHSSIVKGLMEEIIEVRVPPELVWQAWEKAHALHKEGGIVPGVRAKTKGEGSKGFRYQILDVTPGISFSIRWKTLFVRLIFTHTVTPAPKGSEIRYGVKIRGFFAWPVRYFLGNKIRKNLSFVLKELGKRLETEFKTSKGS